MYYIEMRKKKRKEHRINFNSVLTEHKEYASLSKKKICKVARINVHNTDENVIDIVSDRFISRFLIDYLTKTKLHLREKNADQMLQRFNCGCLISISLNWMSTTNKLYYSTSGRATYLFNWQLMLIQSAILMYICIYNLMYLSNHRFLNKPVFIHTGLKHIGTINMCMQVFMICLFSYNCIVLIMK